jgi:hypothetical protein
MRTAPPRCKGLREKGLRAVLAISMLASLTHGGFAVADAERTLGEAIGSGKATVDLRYRYEHVDQDGFAEDANASTLRIRLNYATGTFRDWSAFGEFDYVSELLIDDFDSGGGTSPNRAQYPVVADPDGADLNQLYVEYAGIDDTSLRIGRQRILLDKQRFVGGVGWRQNEQTFDAVTFRYSGWSAADLQYSYVSRVKRIFGDGSAAGRNDGDTHLLHANLTLARNWTLTPYGYFIDNDDVAAFSTRTLGARLAGRFAVGKSAVGERVVSVAGEFATQSDAAAAPVAFDADYLRLDVALTLRKDLSLGVGYEVLGGDRNAAGRAFRTPLATLHAFQGWADQFLTTPDAGIEDLFASITYSRAGWKLQAVAHRFAAASGGADWGDELDVSLGRRFSDRYGLLLKAALFESDNPAYSDVGKFWLMLTATY